MRTTLLRSWAAKLAVAATVLAVVPIASATASSAAAPPSKQFTCVAKGANSCVVTIDLTSNMNEQVGSTMPNRTHKWSLTLYGGPQGKGGYTMSGPGAPQTYWDGKSAGTEGYTWSALLTTGTVSSGDEAVLTFNHVAAAPAKHYKSFNYSYTSKVFTSAPVTITATVTPRPAKGHLLIQRLDAKKWTNVVGCTFSTKLKSWSCTFRWKYPKHTTKEFRLLATAAPGLLATASPAFKISTET